MASRLALLGAAGVRLVSKGIRAILPQGYPLAGLAAPLARASCRQGARAVTLLAQASSSDHVFGTIGSGGAKCEAGVEV